MSRTPTSLILPAILLVVVSAAGGYGLAHLHPKTSATAPPTDAKGKPLYWYDPMVPAQHFDKPGKSPFMDMQLVPRYAGEAAAGHGVAIDPSATQNLGVRLATATRTELASSLETTGVLDFNQRDLAVVQAKAAGFVQRVYQRAPGDIIAFGAPIADLLVPSWGAAQAEFLAVRAVNDPALEAAARQRLKLLGMSDGMIDAVARTSQARGTVTITAPTSGVIQTLDVRQGMTVSAGQTLAQINGIATVWLNAAVPEALAGQLKLHQPVRVTLTAFPTEVFNGQVAAILPTAQADSRTLQARIELPNSGGRLRPGMFGRVQFGGEATPALTVPAEAVIRTGKRDLVMLANTGGKFTPIEVKVGRESGGQTEILEGLTEGQKVVASGQFLIDSEASLAGLQVKPLAAEPAATVIFETKGKVEAHSGNHITFSHDPAPAIGWPAMTMEFALKSPDLAKGLKVGDTVRFGFEQKPDGPVVQMIEKIGGAK